MSKTGTGRLVGLPPTAARALDRHLRARRSASARRWAGVDEPARKRKLHVGTHAVSPAGVAPSTADSRCVSQRSTPRVGTAMISVSVGRLAVSSERHQSDEAVSAFCAMAVKHVADRRNRRSSESTTAR
jgi:hypothetical protein